MKNNVNCLSCHTALPMAVCHSNAGYYLGHWCGNCGPHDRQTGYWADERVAEQALALVERIMAIDPEGLRLYTETGMPMHEALIPASAALYEQLDRFLLAAD